MRLVSLLAILALASCVHAYWEPQRPVCSKEPASYCSRSNCNYWYVDPVNGNDHSNSGSRSSPWKTLLVALWQQMEYPSLTKSYPLDGPLPIPAANLTIKNIGKPIKGGDVIFLMDGDHDGRAGGSFPDIRTVYHNTTLTIASDPMSTKAILYHFQILSSSNIRVMCVTGSANRTRIMAGEDGTIFNAVQNGFYGPAYNIEFINNTAFSYLDYERNLPAWHTSFYPMLNYSVLAFNGITQFSTWKGNYIRNVRRGIFNQGDFNTITDNSINYINGDCFRPGGNHTWYENNLCMNAIANDGTLDNSADHRDCFQIFPSGNSRPQANITVIRNRCIPHIDPTRPFASSFQGISNFHTMLMDSLIADNVLFEEEYHGVGAYGGQNLTIIGNTMLNVNVSTGAFTWINIFENDQPYTNLQSNASFNNLIANNVANSISPGKTTDKTKVANNYAFRWTPAQLNQFFVNPSIGDFRLRGPSAANNFSNPLIGTGSDQVTPFDHLNRRRTPPYDIGAYKYFPEDEKTEAFPSAEGTDMMYKDATCTSFGLKQPVCIPAGSSHENGSVSLAASLVACILMSLLAIM